MQDNTGALLLAVIAIMLAVKFRRYLGLALVFAIPWVALYVLVRFIKWAWSD